MYKRLSAIMFPIVAVALIGSVVWGYQENKDKNTVMIKAENQYQRSFHELSYHMHQLQNELGNVVAVNATSPNFYRKELVNIWRMTNQAQKEMSQLPLSSMPLAKTSEFLQNLSTFSYRTSVRDMAANPMTAGEKATLNTLYQHSKEINGDLTKMQNEVLVKNLRFLDVDTALAAQKEPADNVIIDGFRAVDKRVQGYTDVDWGPSVAGMRQKIRLNALPGNDVSPDEIKRNAAKFLGLQDASGLVVAESGRGTDYNTYTVSAAKPNAQNYAHLDYAKKGGHFLMYMNNRAVSTRTLDVRGARDAAQEFLDTRGYSDMTPVSYDDEGNTASITFARRQDDMIIYPERIVVNVALDNGEVTAVQASDYASEHKQRTKKQPRVSEQQAKRELNPSFEQYDVDQALIRNEMDQEVQCYQFLGRVNGGVYKIFINSDTGEEEKIEQLGGPDVQRG